MKTGALLLIVTLFILPGSPPVTAQSKTAAFDTLYQHATNDRNAGAFDKAIAEYQECLNIATALKDSLRIGNSLICIGISNDRAGRFEDALQYYFKALNVYEHIGNTIKMGGTLKNIGNTYRVMKDYSRASGFLQQALQLQHAARDSARIANVLNDIGLVYMARDSSQKALQYFDTIIHVYGGNIDEDVRAYVLNNLALTQANLKRCPQALRSYQSSLAIMTKNSDQYGIALVSGNMGELYYNMHDFPRALDLHLHNLTLVRRIHSNELLKDTYDNLSKTYKALGNYRKAYEYSLNALRIKDTIYQEQSARSFAEMEARYQNEKKQKEILQLQQNNNLVRIQLLNQKLIKYILLAGIGIILVVAAFLYREYRNKQRRNKELASINSKLEDANNTKTRLISIISHDLRSPVSSLFSFLELKRQNPALLEKEDQQRLDKELTVAADHLLEAMEDLLIWSKSQMDHFSLSTESIQVDQLLDDIARLHQPFAGERHVTLKKEDSAGILLDTDPNFVRVILRNLVSNAIKFTPRGGTITLSGSREDGKVFLRVKDTGPGLSQADIANIFEWNSIRSDSSGLGLRLAREFAEKLGGDISVISIPGEGAAFTVTLPSGLS
jgi:signal transduction histidine kinase